VELLLLLSLLLLLVLLLLSFYCYLVISLAEAGIFSLRHRIQTDSGAHSATYPMSTGGFFPGSKAAGA